MQASTKTAAAVVISLICALIIPAALTLQTVKSPGSLVITSDNPTPLGYTISLSLFIFPMLAIGWWFFRHPTIRFQKRAFLWTVAAVGGEIPIEEFVFYLSGFIVVLLIYIWGDEYWFERYNVPDYPGESQKIERILRFHPISLIIALLLVALAVSYKTMWSGEPGFPWYFIYLTTVALLPSMGLYHCAKQFINWRSFSFTFFIMVLISLLWEVTLAVPYQWWGFQHHAMMGIYIGAWHGLPLEEIVVWFSVTFATVILYEVIKIWQASGRSVKNAFLGV